MLIECGLEKGKLDLEELAEHLLGIRGYYLALSSMMMFAIGGMTAYLVIYGDTMPYVLNAILASYSLTVSREFVMCISATFIILPLCLMKNLESLEWTSSFSVFSDIALALIVAIGAPAAAAQQGIKMDISQLVFARSTIFAGMGTISFAFVCQHNSFLVFRSLREPTQKTWTKVAHGSLIVSFSICCTFGLAGYLNFLDKTKGNVLDNFSDTDKTISVARFFLAVCMILTYPMECFVARHCLLSIINKYYASTNQSNSLYEGSFLRRVVDILSSSSKSLSYTSKKLASEDLNEDNNYSNNSSIVMNSLHSKNDNITEEKDDNGADSNYEITFSILDSTPARICVTVFLWGSTLLVSIIANDLSIVLALTGCLAASFLGYIIPGLVYIKTYENDFHHMINSIMNNNAISFISIMKFGLPIFMIIFGLLSLVIGVTTVLFFDPNE
jgi:amino acid permease